MKKILVICLALFLSACGTTAKFVYPSNSQNILRFPESKIDHKKIAVIPFEDSRPDRNSDVYWFSYIPIIGLAGWSDYERPDAARKFLTIAEFEFNPSEDLAKAAAYSLRKSGLFRDVFFTFGGDKDKANYVLEGEILSTNYNGKLITYGLSIYGSFLWYLGFPAGTSNNKLSLEFTLKNVRTGKVVWKNQYDMTRSVTQGIYYNWGHDTKSYPVMMEDIMNSVAQDLKNNLK